MSNNVVFEDYSIQCKNALKEKALIFLQEAGEEITSMTVRNQVRKTGQTAGSWSDSPVLDEANLAVHMGSNYENAIWEEFGTGEFAEKGDGRKGWWVYVKGSSSGGGGKTYSSQAEAKKAVAILRKKGLDAYYTKGKSARHPFLNAYNSSKSKIIKHAESIFGGL